MSVSSLLAFTGKLDERSQAEISDSEVHVVVEHEVAELEIAMNDRIAVHVVARSDELSEVVTRFGFGISSPPAQEVEEGLFS